MRHNALIFFMSLLALILLYILMVVILFNFVDILYSRTEVEFKRGNFRVKGDTVDIYPAYADFAFRLIFWGDEIESTRLRLAGVARIAQSHPGRCA